MIGTKNVQLVDYHHVGFDAKNVLLIHWADVHIHQSFLAQLSNKKQRENILKKVNLKIKESGKRKIIHVFSGDMVCQRFLGFKDTNLDYFKRSLDFFDEFEGEKIMSFGNHELGHFQTKEIQNILEEKGFIVLRDFEKHEAFGLFFYGFPSFIHERERFDEIENVLQKSQHDDARVFICHNPDAFGLYNQNPLAKNSVTLAGHVHRLHFDLPILRYIAKKVLLYKSAFIHGIYAGKQNQQLVISAGLGHHPGLPIRLNAPPEITFHYF